MSRRSMAVFWNEFELTWQNYLNLEINVIAMGKRAITFIILVIMLLSLTFSSTNTSALTATVVVKFDLDDLEYTYGRNDSNILIVSGNITCVVDGLIEGYQYIKVELFAGENNGWGPAVSPSVTRFYESGIQGFNASILIPAHADNRTDVRLGVSGSWYVEPHGEKVPDSTGTVYSDRINITIIRPEPPFIKEMYEGGSHGSEPYFNWLGFPNVLVTVVLPLFCVVLISYFAIRRMKRKTNK